MFSYSLFINDIFIIKSKIQVDALAKNNIRKVFSAEKLIKLLWLTLGLTILAVIVVGANTYDANTEFGRVIDASSIQENEKNIAYLQVSILSSDEPIVVEIHPDNFCPVGADVVIYVMKPKLFGVTRYEFVSCELP